MELHTGATHAVPHWSGYAYRCSACDGLLKADYVLCPGCGARLSSPVPAAPPPDAASAPVSPQPAQAGGGSGRVMILAALALAVVVGGGTWWKVDRDQHERDRRLGAALIAAAAERDRQAQEQAAAEAARQEAAARQAAQAQREQIRRNLPPPRPRVHPLVGRWQCGPMLYCLNSDGSGFRSFAGTAPAGGGIDPTGGAFSGASGNPYGDVMANALRPRITPIMWRVQGDTLFTADGTDRLAGLPASGFVENEPKKYQLRQDGNAVMLFDQGGRLEYLRVAPPDR